MKSGFKEFPSAVPIYMAVLFFSLTVVGAAQEVLPRPEQPFEGKIGRTVKDSTPDFPKGVTAPPNAPNVLLIITDDVGFGATSTFGGPIQTPTFQRLADNGLRYNMFHTTALCSPTRAALITGRNHHSVASGVITEFATGYPGYNSLVPKSAGSVGEVLRENGYNTSWFGKMHNVPDWMSSQAGPFHLCPSRLGFAPAVDFEAGLVAVQETIGEFITYFNGITEDRRRCPREDDGGGVTTPAGCRFRATCRRSAVVTSPRPS